MDVERILRTADSARERGHLGDAERLYREVLGADEGSRAALLGVGALLAQTGRNDEAVAILRRARVADPASYDASRWLAGLLLGREGGTEAIECAMAAARIQPDEAEAHAILGLAYLAAFRFAPAVAGFERAVELSPEMAGAYHNLGLALQGDDRSLEAIEAFRTAIRLAPNSAVSHLHLGKLYLSRGDADEAIACFQAAITIVPNLRSAKSLLADALYVGIRGDRGEEYLRRELEANPAASFPRALLGARLQEQGRFDEAEVTIRQSLDLEPRQGLGYYAYAHNRKMRDSDRPMVAQMETAAAEPSLHETDRRYVMFALGKAYDDLKEYEKAIAFLDRANGEGTASSDSESASAKNYEARANHFIGLFTREFLAEHSGVGSESEQPIFILGMPRSGSTLTEQILSRHSQVGAGGEQSFWRDHRRKIVDLNAGTVDFTRLGRACGDYLKLLESLAPGKARVTDKFPGNFIHLGLLYLAFPRAKFIHTTRNPIDTCLSIYMRPFFTLNEFGHSRRNIVDAYQVYRRLMAHWRSVLPAGQVFDVRYEELVQDTEGVTRRLLAHCGLEWEESCLHPEEAERRVRTYSMWQVRQPVYTTSVERWRNYEPWLGVFRELLND